MALIKEDGTGLDPNANSYGDLAGLKLYAAGRNIDITAIPDPELETYMIRAMDLIEGFRSKFLGRRTSSTQPLQWPRSDVWIDDSLYSSDEMPRELEYAHYAYAIEAKDHDLQPTSLPTDKGAVVSERVEGAVTVVYENNSGKRLRVPAFAKAETLIRVLFKRSGLTLVRS